MNNIHPIFDTILTTQQKEDLIGQSSVVIWMVGLSGSGKSTLARGLENKLHEAGFLTTLLDGDNLRTGINNNLAFSPEDRFENIRRAAEVSKLFAANGLVTICSLISPTDEIRQMAAKIIGEKYCEVYVNCPLEVCEKRDVKGLYKKARAGEIPDFTGISAPFEEPKEPWLEIRTDKQQVDECLELLVKKVINKVKRDK